MNFKRTNYCADFGINDCGKTVVVCGWVAKSRNLGTIIFADIRDRSGIVQCVFDKTVNTDLFDSAETLRAEFTVAVRGTVRERSSKNPNIKTGDIEILADGIEIFAKADTPPFEILDDTNANEALRLKYRYLDLRRAPLQKAIVERHRIVQILRNFFDSEGFIDIETPILTKSTPEGARDYLVPSRVHKGEFYALPQSPQQYKQLLMLAGFDKYVQFARCFRDEDLRADRQPEFTQVDLEMSFADEESVMDVVERAMQTVMKKFKGIDLRLPLRRMTYAEAMRTYGSDKPDLRFEMTLCDVTEILGRNELPAFADAAGSGGAIALINAKGLADKLSRKTIDALGEFVKTYKAKGLAWIKLDKNEVSSSFAKFLTDEDKSALFAKADAHDGDVLFIIADRKIQTAQTALGALRCEIAKRYDLIPHDRFEFLWITEFPEFEYSETEERYVAMHHPFTAPFDEDIQYFESAPEKVRSRAFDIVLNGIELASGSVRINKPELQRFMFRALGFTEEAAQQQFGHLIEAYRYGAPPHAGIGFGVDRLCLVLGQYDSLRDVIAFPKVQNASELMTACPSPVTESQLDELGIALKPKDE